ncbi:MAG: nucleotidyltransferase family protein [Proteobacteria bacterium]|nr:nucleotidyltransferase family protein [Pseudomonadota bacterium]
MAPLDAIDVAILAGGQGTRLRAVLPDGQKVMAEIDGRPFLDHLLDQVAKAGARRIVLALGHRADEVSAYISRRQLADTQIVSSFEDRPLGTGGALRLALPHLGSQTVLVLNGDSYAAVDFAALLALHRSRRARATLTLIPVADRSRYGAVRSAAGGAIIAFEEKRPQAAGPGDINGGVYLIEREAIAAIAEGRPVSLERDVFPGLCGAGLYGLRQAVPFIDIGTPESLRAASAFFAGHAR